MSPQVEAAIIAASVGVVTLIATVVTQYLGRRNQGPGQWTSRFRWPGPR